MEKQRKRKKSLAGHPITPIQFSKSRIESRSTLLNKNNLFCSMKMSVVGGLSSTNFIERKLPRGNRTVNRQSLALRAKNEKVKVKIRATGRLIDILGMTIAKRNALLFTSIRDFIFQRIKTVAFLLFLRDFFELKKQKIFTDCFSELFEESCFDFIEFRQSKISDYISEQTPKFFVSREDIKDCCKSPKAEEALYVLMDFLTRKMKHKAFSLLNKASPYKGQMSPVKSKRMIKQYSQPIKGFFKGHFNLVSSSVDAMKYENMKFLLNIISILIGNKKLKYSQIFYFLLRKNLQQERHREEAYKLIQSRAKTIGKIGFIILKKRFNEQIKVGFDKILNYAQTSSLRRSSVVYGRIKDLRRSITPSNNSSSQFFFRKSTNKSRSSLKRNSY